MLITKTEVVTAEVDAIVARLPDVLAGRIRTITSERAATVGKTKPPRGKQTKAQTAGKKRACSTSDGAASSANSPL